VDTLDKKRFIFQEGWSRRPQVFTTLLRVQFKMAKSFISGLFLFNVSG
jgi:hypothetical protein